SGTTAAIACRPTWWSFATWRSSPISSCARRAGERRAAACTTISIIPSGSLDSAATRGSRAAARKSRPASRSRTVGRFQTELRVWRAGQARPIIAPEPTMPERDFLDVVDEIRERDPRYRREAYLFIMAALDQVVTRLSRPRHVTGQELLAGTVELAREQFGP